jgi:hypothetical protein
LFAVSISILDGDVFSFHVAKLAKCGAKNVGTAGLTPSVER